MDLQAVIDAALSAVGQPYVWGGNSLTSGVDCSGLIQQAFKAAGISLPRVSNQQARAGSNVGGDMDNWRPGDVLWWDLGSRNVGADHVALYLGNGMMVEALHRGAPVHVVPVRRPDGVTRMVDGDTSNVHADYGDASDTQAEVGPNDSLEARLAAIMAAITPGFAGMAMGTTGSPGGTVPMPTGRPVTEAVRPMPTVNSSGMQGETVGLPPVEPSPSRLVPRGEVRAV